MPSEQEQSLPEGCPACGALPCDWAGGANPQAFIDQMDGDKALGGDAVFLADLARRLRDVPAVHVDGGDVDELKRIAVNLATPAPDKALLPEAAVGELANLIPLLWCWDPETDDRTVPLLVAEAGRRDARSYDIDDAENVIAFLLSLLTTPTPVEEPANAATGAEQRAALLDLLAVIHRDGGHKTQEIGWRLAHEQAMQKVSEMLAATNAGQVEAARWIERAREMMWHQREKADDYLNQAIAALSSKEAGA